ncbi:MAG: COR domain-containing protein [Candidatus Electrothrix aestuarii]|uniref:non-specific serine/threonine protein kinase n=1 Tax=Candidatus Electrothrix aestuarii TaxID=3062594 RepID=A0AAU8LUB9_9BACT|nr:COR domain-containing protein [Candidatus Electrothrix aestuarii]
MNQEEIEKELEQLSSKWVTVFTARIVAQFIPKLLINKTNIVQPFANPRQRQGQRELLEILWVTAKIEYLYEEKYKNSLRKRFHHPVNIRFFLGPERKYFIQASYSLISDICFFYKYSGHTFELIRLAQSVDIDITNELTSLKTYLNSGKKIVDYLYQSLYIFQNLEWLQLGQKLVQSLRGYGSGFDIWADWFQGRIDGVPTNKEFLEAVVNLPDEILDQEPAQINAYLKNLCQTERPLNRVRVIFLGYGEAGKTSLIRALNGLEVDEGKEKMTPGIDISTWKVPDTEITAHFWDFGGQVVAHATHQFFLRSRCLYVLLLDGRTEINANEQAEYWLEHVRAFGNKAPVMLVGNKADLCAVNLDMARLKEKHPNVLGFYPLSCTKWQNEYAPEFQRFQKDLSKEVAELGVHQIRFGKAHLAVLDELTERSGTESFLPKTDWLDLCADKGLAEQGDLNQAWLLDLFDKLGVIVHFPKLAALDSYILNPRWLTYGVYTLLYSPAAKEKQGRLDRDEIVRLLSAARVEDNLGNVLSYPAEKAAIVIQAMEQFKLCFPCRHEPDMIIIPALLNSDRPEHGFAKKDSLAFEFDFTGFLPRHIMPNFIVGRHDEIKGELVWQNGVVLQRKDESAEALVQVDYHDRKLALWLRGPKANDYFKILYDDLCRILERMPELRFEEFVIVPEASRIGEPPLSFRRSEQVVRADFQDLLALEENNGTEYICKAGKFDLGKILQIMPREARPAYQNENSGKTIYHIGKMEGDIMSGEAKKNGSNYTVGNIGDGSNVVVGSNEIKDSFYAIAQSAAEPALKAKLEELCQQVEQMLPQLPEEKREEAAQDLDSLVKEATKESPRRKWYELSAEGLIEAAKACAGMAAPVTTTVKSILTLLKAT